MRSGYRFIYVAHHCCLCLNCLPTGPVFKILFGQVAVDWSDDDGSPTIGDSVNLRLLRR